MDMSGIVNKMRQEFAKELDNALAQEARQHQLEEAELEALAEVLPEVIIPPLSASDEKKALALQSNLDKKIGQFAELTAQICQLAVDYRRETGELNGLLMNKKHNIHNNHSQARLPYIANKLAKIIEFKLMNALVIKTAVPTKQSIHKEISGYNGV